MPRGGFHEAICIIVLDRNEKDLRNNNEDVPLHMRMVDTDSAVSTMRLTLTKVVRIPRFTERILKAEIVDFCQSHYVGAGEPRINSP